MKKKDLVILVADGQQQAVIEKANKLAEEINATSLTQLGEVIQIVIIDPEPSEGSIITKLHWFSHEASNYSISRLNTF